MTRYRLVLFALTIAVHTGLCDEATDVAKNRFFHVSVEGTVAEAIAATGTRAQMIGKAFAVSPDVLITAGHVVKEMRFWRNKGTPDGVAIPDRTVKVSWMDSYERGIDPRSSSDFYVTYSTIDTADVASLTAPQQRASAGGFPTFGVSTEDIVRSKTYRALLVDDHPEQADSIKNPILVDLRPIRHDHAYGGLYVFEVIGTARTIQRGDSGSPVLDDKENVVGLISGRTQDGRRALVTLASWFSRSSLIPDQRIRDQESQARMHAERILDQEELIRTLQSTLDSLKETVMKVRFESGVILLNNDSDPSLLADTGRRGHNLVRINFDRPFSSPPMVVVALSTIDIVEDGDSRIVINVKDVDTTGFNYDFLTWGDTKLRSARAQWIALPR